MEIREELRILKTHSKAKGHVKKDQADPQSPTHLTTGVTKLEGVKSDIIGVKQLEDE